MIKVEDDSNGIDSQRKFQNMKKRYYKRMYLETPLYGEIGQVACQTN